MPRTNCLAAKQLNLAKVLERYPSQDLWRLKLGQNDGQGAIRLQSKTRGPMLMLGDTDFLYWRRRMNSGQTERITPKGLKLLAGGLSAANTTGYVLLKRIDPDRVSQQTALRRPIGVGVRRKKQPWVFAALDPRLIALMPIGIRFVPTSTP